MNPLHIAAQVGNSDAVATFLRQNASTVDQTHGLKTPLHVCAESQADSVTIGRHALICIHLINSALQLLAAGAPVDFIDEKGRTALRIAAFRGLKTH